MNTSLPSPLHGDAIRQSLSQFYQQTNQSKQTAQPEKNSVNFQSAKPIIPEFTTHFFNQRAPGMFLDIFA